MAPIPVELDPELENRLHSLLERLNLLPVLTPPPQSTQRSCGVKENEITAEGHNMIVSYNVADFDPRPRQSAQLVSWCPPTPNWNPWTACNIDEGPEVRFSPSSLFVTNCVSSCKRCVLALSRPYNLCLRSVEHTNRGMMNGSIVEFGVR